MEISLNILENENFIYDGTTGLDPLDHFIKNADKYDVASY